MRLAKVGAPETTTDGDDGELGDDDSSADGSRDFLGGLDAETNVAVGVANDDDSLETGTLTGTGLLLDGLDLHDLILQAGALHRKSVSNLFEDSLSCNCESGLAAVRVAHTKLSTIWYLRRDS